ncbi:MAG TPA: hypothetical protein VEI54_00670 [Candidatus Limnocylindrales bacterium]|nr:hypothetical protein [Candidatus Limnocylindrales bacterium]
MRKISYPALVLVVGLTLIGVAVAQRPETDIDPHRHSNLAAAQRHIVEAYEKVKEAQRSNNDDLGGHGERAIELLNRASRELKEAAEYVDRNHRE